MKEIKKYLDQFFKEIKEIQKEILSLTEQSINEPESKRDIQNKHNELAESLNKNVKKCYNKI